LQFFYAWWLVNGSDNAAKMIPTGWLKNINLDEGAYNVSNTQAVIFEYENHYILI
jgi:hypothetical protein